MRLARILALLALLCGCNYSDEPSDLVAVRDSIGITIVEYPDSLRSLPVAFHIGEVPLLDLGGRRSNSDHELDPSGPFHDADQLSDGRYIVTDMAVLKVFNAQGQYLQTIGRPGQGPGEFQRALAVCVAPGDTIVATHNTRRVSVFDRNGDHVRTFSLAAIGDAQTGCFADGSLVVTSDAITDSSHAVTTASRLNADGSARILGPIPSRPRVVFPMTTADATGVVASGDDLYVGFGDLPEVFIFSSAGELSRIIRWTESTVEFSDDVILDLISSGRFEMSIEGMSAEDQFPILRDQPRLANLPAYRGMKVDAIGRIWIEDHPYRTSEPLAWTVIDPNGQPLGRVQLPEIPGSSAEPRLGQIGEDHVFLIWRDKAVGFVHVTMHSLEAVASGD